MTKNSWTVGLLLAAGLALGTPARADEWDLGADNDSGTSTDNALFHGAEQTHDLEVHGGFADADWYIAATLPFSSYQFVVDGMTGDLDLATDDVQRLDGLGSSVLESGVVTDFGGVVHLDWLRGEGTAPAKNLIRVQGAACGLSCDSQDRYRARFYDTTYTVPRFNNTATQSTVLLVQNATDRSCVVTFFFMNNAGALLNATSAGSVNPNQLLVVATATAVPNQSGSVRVAHTCGYGGLSGKAVSVEPATGFTFDTPLLHRPH
jgi:hypothetical protein